MFLVNKEPIFTACSTSLLWSIHVRFIFCCLFAVSFRGCIESIYCIFLKNDYFVVCVFCAYL